MKINISENIEDSSPFLWLEQKVADHYAVSPVDSRGSYEDVICDDKNITIRAKTFAYSVPDDSMRSLRIAVEMIWADISSMFRKHSFVIWRVRPYLEYIIDKCACCNGEIKHLIVRCRIGSSCEIEGVDTSVKEGVMVKKIPV